MGPTPRGKYDARRERLAAWRDQVPERAKRIRSHLDGLIAELAKAAGWKTYVWGDGDIFDRVTEAESMRADADDVFAGLRALEEEAERLEETLGASDDPAMAAVRERLNEFRAEIVRLFSVILRRDDMEDNRRRARAVLETLRLEVEAVRLLQEAQRLTGQLQRAAAMGFEQAVAAFRSQLGRATPAAAEVSTFEMVVRASTPAQMPPREPLDLHALEHLLSDARSWLLLMPSPDRDRPLNDLAQRLESLRQQGDAAARDALQSEAQSACDAMRDEARHQRLRVEQKFGTDLRLLSTVTERPVEVQTAFDDLRNLPLESWREWEDYRDAQDKLQNRFDDWVQLAATALLKGWQDATVRQRERFAAAERIPRLRGASGELERLRRGLERGGFQEGQESRAADGMLEGVRTLDGLRHEIDEFEKARLAELEQFCGSLRERSSRATSWAAVSTRIQGGPGAAAVVDALTRIEGDLDTPAIELDGCLERMHQAQTALESLADGLEARARSVVAAAAADYPRMVRALEDFNPVLPEPPDWRDAGGDPIVLLTAIARVDGWRRDVDGVVNRILSALDDDTASLAARLQAAKIRPTATIDESDRITDLLERKPIADAAHGLDGVRAYAEWKFEAETFLDGLDRGLQDVKAQLDELHYRLRVFRDRGFGEFHPPHAHRLEAVVAALPSEPTAVEALKAPIGLAMALLGALERDAIRRVADQTHQDRQELRSLVERADDGPLKDRGRKILADIDRLGTQSIPSLSQRNTLANAVRNLRR